MTDTGTSVSPRAQFAHAAAMQCWVWAYPLTESLRTCHEATAANEAATDERPAINQFAHVTRPSTHVDRWVVTPANDLLYSTAWLNLADGPVVLDVPAPTERHFVFALLDAHTNNWANVGPNDCGSQPTRHAIVGPQWSGELPAGMRVIQAPTDLVWVIGRILVDDEQDLSAAQDFQQQFKLTPLTAGQRTQRPHSVEAFDNSGEPLAFYANVARALEDFPVAEAERGLVAQFTAIGIRPGTPFDPAMLEPDVREALIRAEHDAREYILSTTRSSRARSWGINYKLGVYGFDYWVRAATAMKGLGALVGSEALYAMSDFDSEKRPLDGSHRYVLHFPADQLPPVDAFWSVTMYGADFFMIPNAINRYAIGDRTRGLQYNPDGSLTLRIQHEAPEQGDSNWLPAPEGPFYLILRMYRAREEVLNRSYRIPAVTRLD